MAFETQESIKVNVFCKKERFTLLQNILSIPSSQVVVGTEFGSQIAAWDNGSDRNDFSDWRVVAICLADRMKARIRVWGAEMCEPLNVREVTGYMRLAQMSRNRENCSNLSYPKSWPNGCKKSKKKERTSTSLPSNQVPFVCGLSMSSVHTNTV